jgi:DNA repair protein RecN (Recombination protein N)
MLRELYVENFAIIGQMRLQLGAGLNALTGETGAGKSLVIDAVALLIGGRGGDSFIRSGFERCVMYLTGMKNIRDVIPYPRTSKNLNY